MECGGWRDVGSVELQAGAWSLEGRVVEGRVETGKGEVMKQRLDVLTPNRTESSTAIPSNTLSTNIR